MNQRETEAVAAAVASLDQWMERETETIIKGARRDGAGALQRRDEFFAVRRSLSAVLPEPAKEAKK